MNFKKFMEDLDPSLDKKTEDKSDKMDYFGELGDELGMDWKDIVSTMEMEPWVSAHFKLGGIQHKLSAWQIVPGTMSQHGADIELKPQKGDRSYLKDGKMLDKGARDTKRYHLGRQELIKFMTTGWTPALQAAQSGGLPGQPGGLPGL